jgi:hypothetical protein
MLTLAKRGTPTPILDGRQIGEVVGRTPGPWTSRAVAALREEQIVGTVTTRAQAERFLRAWVQREGDPVG